MGAGLVPLLEECISKQLSSNDIAAASREKNMKVVEYEGVVPGTAAATPAADQWH